MDLIKGLRTGTERSGLAEEIQILRARLELEPPGVAPERFLAAVLAAVLGRFLSCEEVVLAVEAEDSGVALELPVAVAPDLPFGTVLERVERACAEADLGSSGPSSSAGNQLLAHALVCAPGSLARESARPWRLQPKNVELTLANVDFALAWDAEGAEGELSLAFSGDPLEAARMEVLLESTIEAAGSAASQANSSPLLANLSLVPPSMRETILRDFNDTDAPLSDEETVLDLIEEEILTHPGNTAYVFEEAALSYAELGARAEWLAATLQARGIQKGDLVGLLVGNSLELPVSMLACMKLGAVFIPMDEMWPEERLRSLLRDTDPAAAIAFDTANVPEEMHDRVVDPRPDAQDPRLPLAPAELTQADLFYGIPTSGSTGPPKCSLNIHRGLVNRFQYMTRRYASGQHEVVLQNSRPAFDSSLWQLIWPLTNGATVVIPRLSKQLDLGHTIELIHRHRVTMTDFVPSVFNTLVRQLEQSPEDVARLTSLQNLLIGGEEINPNFCRRFGALLPETRLTNTYGPTEASIGMVFHEVDTQSDAEIPIGRPIDNTYAVILDERMSLVPPGMIGELYIGGVCLGAGYLRDPERTARAWVPNPFEELEGDQLYLTGDLVHQAPDGTLHFVGRKDGQVKIAGTRLELGEVENLLVQHPRVDRAVVLVEETGAGDRLVAYLTSGSPPKPVELKEYLSGRLPKQGVPSRFVFLDELPLNHNGKLDRKKLAAMTASSGARTVGESPAEIALFEIWRELLGRDDFGLDDDFFLLGGDSLLVVHLLFDVTERFEKRFPLRTVYEAPTIRRLAAIVSGDESAARGPSHEEQLELAEEDRRLLDDLPSSVVPLSPSGGQRNHNPVRGVLITGATGFIGAHIVASLMERSEAEVFYLARDANEAAAAARLRETMSGYGLWSDSFAARLRPVKGSLEAPGLGLSDAELARLAGEVESVVNCAGMVDFLHDYRRHRPVNVNGAAEVLRLAAIDGGPRSIHHISSLNIGDRANAPTDGYGLSKWAAERLAEAAIGRGYDVTVHRLGEVMPHSRFGHPNTKALSYLFIYACLTVGLYPEGLVALDYSPADWVAEAIVDSILGERTRNVVSLFHPTGTTIDEIMSCAGGTGVELNGVSGADFYRALQARGKWDGDRSLHSLMCLIDAALQEQDDQDDVDLALSNLFIRPDAEREGGPSIGWAAPDWPEIDAEVLAPMVAETAPTCAQTRAYSA